MSASISPEVQQDLKALNKHANDLLKNALQYVLQPEYAPKARQSVDALLTFVGPVSDVLKDPAKIHHTTLDTGLKNLQAVGKVLPEAAKQAYEVSFRAVLADIKKLRAEVPRPEVMQTNKPAVKI